MPAPPRPPPRPPPSPSPHTLCAFLQKKEIRARNAAVLQPSGCILSAAGPGARVRASALRIHPARTISTGAAAIIIMRAPLISLAAALCLLSATSIQPAATQSGEQLQIRPPATMHARALLASAPQPHHPHHTPPSPLPSPPNPRAKGLFPPVREQALNKPASASASCGADAPSFTCPLSTLPASESNLGVVCSAPVVCDAACPFVSPAAPSAANAIADAGLVLHGSASLNADRSRLAFTSAAAFAARLAPPSAPPLPAAAAPGFSFTAAFKLGNAHLAGTPRASETVLLSRYAFSAVA